MRIFLIALAIMVLNVSTLRAQEGIEANTKSVAPAVSNGSDAKSIQAENKKVFICPMCAGVQSATPGKCPKCGMDLVEAFAKNEEESTSVESEAGQMGNRGMPEAIDEHAGHSHDEAANETKQ